LIGGLALKPPKTETLLSGILRLSKTSDLKTMMNFHSEAMNPPSLKDYICNLCLEKKLSHELVINQADIERSYGHEIFRGDKKNPSRDKVIQLAFGFKMDVREAQELLRVARVSALYSRIKRDAAIIFCLNKGKSVAETRIVLESLNLPDLGGKAE
jgi:hypothetical protein